MKAKYPKHPWPEDGMAAEATRLTKKGLERRAAASRRRRRRRRRDREQAEEEEGGEEEVRVRCFLKGTPFRAAGESHRGRDSQSRRLLHSCQNLREAVRCVAASSLHAAPPPRHSSAHDILNTTHHFLHHGLVNTTRVLATLATPRLLGATHGGIHGRRVGPRSRPPTLPRDAGSPRNSRTPASEPFASTASAPSL